MKMKTLEKARMNRNSIDKCNSGMAGSREYPKLPPVMKDHNNKYNCLFNEDDEDEEDSGSEENEKADEEEDNISHNYIFNITKRWDRTMESEDDSTEHVEDDESWYTPRSLDLSLAVTREEEVYVDPVEGLTYQGHQFTNHIEQENPLWAQLNSWNNSNQVINAVETEETVVDGHDNLTYREDSLSVIKGRVSTKKGVNLPVWIVTDSGAMTQLIEKVCRRDAV